MSWDLLSLSMPEERPLELDGGLLMGVVGRDEEPGGGGENL